jgi:hypothetical protein
MIRTGTAGNFFKTRGLVACNASTGPTLMRKARHLDISNRLEVTKRHGLVDDYRVEWQRRSFCPPHVTVKGRTSVPRQVTKNYVAMLLAPFVASERIDVI